MVHFSCLKKMKPWDIYRVDMGIKGGIIYTRGQKTSLPNIEMVGTMNYFMKFMLNGLDISI